MATYRIREAADLLGVSDDTLRRWCDGGRLATSEDESGRRVVDGADLAAFARERAADAPAAPPVGPVAGRAGRRVSARNRFTGLVTRVVLDAVMAQVELQAGQHRVVSLLSREAVEELGLEPGVLAVASVKATSVVLEVPGRPGA
jgi:molybdopterin-binding protein